MYRSLIMQLHRTLSSPILLWRATSSWQRSIIFFSLLCAGLAVLITRDLPEEISLFQLLFFIHDLPASFIVLALSIIAMFFTDGKGVMQGLFAAAASRTGWLTGLLFLICSLGAWLVYHRHPLSMDEYAALLQSRVFAAGKLTGKIPPNLADVFLPPLFHDWFLHISRDTGAVAATYWPSFSLVMAPFAFLGVPWLCNPTITALSFIAFSSLLREIVSVPAARGFAVVSFLASPVILLNGMSYYGMPLQLFCSLMFSLAIVRGTTPWLLAGGAFAAVGLTTVNPVPFGLFALPWLLWGIPRLPQWRQKLLRLALLGLPLALILGLGWKLFLIHTFGHSHQDAVSSSFTSMAKIFTLPSVSLLAVREIGLIKLCLSTVPGLAALAYLSFRYKQNNKWVGLMKASAISLLVGYLFVPFDQGAGWGYRYFHAAWFVIPILAALTLQKISEEPIMRQRAYGFAFVASLGAVLILSPMRLYQAEKLISFALSQLPARAEPDIRQVVFINVDCGFQSIDLVQNDPFLRSKEIHLVSQGYEEDRKTAMTLGTKPYRVSSKACGDRWLLD